MSTFWLQAALTASCTLVGLGLLDLVVAIRRYRKERAR